MTDKKRLGSTQRGIHQKSLYPNKYLWKDAVMETVLTQLGQVKAQASSIPPNAVQVLKLS